MDPERMKELEKQFSSRPQSPVLNPEQSKKVISIYRGLPQDRKDILKRLMQHPCPYCEVEFKVPTIGSSHGICERHKQEFYAKNNMPPPKPNPNNHTVDLKTLDPKEIQLAVDLYSIIRRKNKERDPNGIH